MEVCKTILAIMLIAILSAMLSPAFGQEVLQHSYTFEEGTYADTIVFDQTNTLDGILVGNGTIANGAYTAAADGDYIKLRAAELAVNSYTAITLEAFIYADVDNTGATMLAYFGDSINGVGGNGYFFTPDRWSESRTGISCGNTTDPWNVEQGITASQVNVGGKHHVVSVLTDSTIALYLDGTLAGVTEVSGDNSISNLSTANAWICKGGYSADPTWQGTISEFNIYEGVMDAATVAARAAMLYSPDQDSVALVALYNATNGPDWTNNTGWTTGPLDTWYGITLNEAGRVTTIDLNNNNLTGTLPEEIGQLSELQSLVLWGNSISGELPIELCNLSNLYNLDLGLNQFTGSIPEAIGQLSNLQTLFIGSGSTLTGEIPASLGNLTNLRILALDQNQLSGEIPDELGNLVQLEELYLELNQLSGAIPENFQNLNLFTLNLGGNQLSGNLPEFMGQQTNLIVLNLWGNLFEGAIPATFAELTNISTLDLSNNFLSDTIPAELGNLGYLSFLYLNYNELSGTIPQSLCDLPLVEADFTGNWFDATSCEAFNCLYNQGVDFWDIYQTQQTGFQLSTCVYNPDAYCENIGLVGDFNNWGNDGSDVQLIQNRNDSTEWTVKYNFTEATSVKFRQNQSWDINWGGSKFPEGFAEQPGANIWVPAGFYTINFNCASSSYSFEVSELTVEACSVQDSLALVDLYYATNGDNWTNNENWLVGPVASWYGVTMQDSNVTQLWLDNNNLSDSLPVSLGDLSQLEIMALGGNGFGGHIPEELGNLENLKYLFLWGNNMIGQISATLGQLSNLIILSLNGNQLSGELPAELGLCDNLQEINLDWNNLEGAIPTELCNISGLSSVNLASNYFDSNSCAAISCLSDKGITFNGDAAQTQKSGYALIGDCDYVADSALVTFRVNMQNESIAAQGVFLNGSFSNWEESVLMQLESGTTYSATLLLPAGQFIKYKFINGYDYEFPPGNCTVEEYHNRELFVPHSGSDLLLEVVCFGGCVNCADAEVQQYTIREIQGEGDATPLDSQLVRTGGRIIALNEYGFFMQDTTGDRSGIFVYDPVLATQLNQGDNIEIVALASEYNGRTQLSETEWFDYTDAYFDVHLTEVQVADIAEDYEGVFVALKNLTVLEQNAYQEYVAVSEANDTVIIDNYLIEPVMEIGESYNVYGIVDYQYGRFAVNPRAQAGIIRLYDLTFQVDMQNTEPDPSGVFVGGDWNDWMSWVEPESMSPQGNIYATTVKVPEGAVISYRFMNGQAWEIVLGDCAAGQNGDRVFTMPNSPVVLDPVCFSKCVACDSVNSDLPIVVIDNLQETMAGCNGATGDVFVQYTVNEVGTILDKGILFGPYPNLLYSSTQLSEGSGAGTIPTTIGGLEAGTYYLCAYAQNEAGISYSEVEQFYIAEPDLLYFEVEEELGESSVNYAIFGFGGIPPYTYQITLCSEDSVCTEYSWQTENEFYIDNLAQLATYQAFIELMDVNGCTASQRTSFVLAPENTIQLDSLALVALYNATDGPNWSNQENWLSGPIDTWYGVQVENGRVVSIDLSNNNLVGTLPSRIGKLSALENFVAWGNQLRGELPPELGDLSNLVSLDLGLNQFYGELPSALGNLSMLESLFIGSGSQLTGSIPASFGQLTKLKILALDGNQLSGYIPAELGELTLLNYLFLQGNSLSGSIPYSFAGLESLNVLYLDHNNLSGAIPAGLCNLPLGEINLEQNYFHIYSCEAIRCLKENNVVFAGDTLQTQINGLELTQECMLPSLKMLNAITPELTNGTLCNPSQNEPVILRFCNDGVEPVEGIQLFYVLNGDSIELESYPEIVYPGDTIDYQFMVSADLQPDIYMDHYTMNVYLLWQGGMIGGWIRTQTFDAIKYIPDAPDWTTFNTCNGLPGNLSYGMNPDKNGDVWSVSNDGAYKFDGSTWEKYTNLDGLSDAANYDVYTDHRGYTWFSGSGSYGLSYYNGSSFYTFHTDGTYSSCIYEDSNGNLWFGSRNGYGVARLNTRFQWSYFYAWENNLGGHINSIGEDVNGILYFSSPEGITAFDGVNWVSFQIPGNTDIVNKIFLDKKGNTWFTTWNSFYRFDGSAWEVFTDPEQIILNCADIEEDIYGNLWFGGGNELVKFDGTSWTKYGVGDGLITALGGNITSLSVIKGDIWIGTLGGGISRFDQSYINLGLAGLVSPGRNQYPNYLYCGLSNNEPVTVRIYNNGDFPVSDAVFGYSLNGDTISLDTLDFILEAGDTVDYTFEHTADFYHTDLVRSYLLNVFVVEAFGDESDNTISGSMKVDGDFQDAPGWTTYNSCDGMISDISFCITEDKNGDIWSTSFYGADRFDGSTWTSYTANNGLNENYSWAIEKDSDGNVWFAGTEDSVITKYDGVNFSYYPQPAVFEECIYNDSKGNIWFGSWDGGGIARFDGQNWTYYWSDDIGFGTNITSIGEDVLGNIWVASYGPSAKIFQFDGANWHETALPIPADGAIITEIFFDSKGNTWFTSTGLITKFDGTYWEFFDTEDGIAEYCDDISEDINGNIWFGGDRELVMFNGSEWTKYTVNEGLAAAQLGGIYSVYADTKGNVWVGTFYGGISKFKIPVQEVCTTLQFETGWNLFSVPVQLDSARVGYNFQPLIDHGSLLKIQDELGVAFEDNGVFGDWDDSEMKLLRPYDGFKINMNWYDSLQVCGVPVSYPYPIYLYEGWNIMGYPQSTSADAQEVIQQLIDRGTLIKVQDEAGNSIEDLGVFGSWTNFIGNMTPGEGYKIKVSNNDTVWIYESYTKSSVAPRQVVQPVHFATAWSGNGVDHMNFNIVDLPAGQMQAGDELAVYDGTMCVGAVSILPQQLESGVVAIAVSAADNYGMPGFGDGNAFELRWWSAENQSEQLLDPDLLSGPAVFAKHESVLLSLQNFSDIDKELIKNRGLNCYPNPFSSELIIEAGLAEAAEVDVQVINQLGQMVNHLVNCQDLNAGIHRWYWDGANGSGQKADPGIYYIRFRANDKVLINKVIMTK